MNVHSSFISKGKKLKTTLMSFSGWMVKQTVVHPYHGILLSNQKELPRLHNDATYACKKSVHTPKYIKIFKRKRKKLLIHATTWMDFKGIMLNEKSQPHKITFCMILFTQHSWNDKITEMEDRTVVATGWGEGIRKGCDCGCKRAAKGIHVTELSLVMVVTWIYTW